MQCIRTSVLVSLKYIAQCILMLLRTEKDLFQNHPIKPSFMRDGKTELLSSLEKKLGNDSRDRVRSFEVGFNFLKKM